MMSHKTLDVCDCGIRAVHCAIGLLVAFCDTFAMTSLCLLRRVREDVMRGQDISVADTAKLLRTALKASLEPFRGVSTHCKNPNKSLTYNAMERYGCPASGANRAILLARG
jgi:hypothetical protein